MKQVEQTIYTSEADLQSSDRVERKMLPWCNSLHDSRIIVMESGLVLTDNLYSRDLPNCRVMMRDKNLTVTRIQKASSNLIEQLQNSVEIEAGAIKINREELSNTQEQLRALVLDAIKVSVSDIHIEVRSSICHVRFRKHGELILYREWSPEEARRLCFVAFNKESDHLQQHFNPLVPQDAAMQLVLSDQSSVRIRLASIPAHPQPSFDVTLRILTTTEKIPTFNELGYSKAQEHLFRMAMQRPHGALLISGPTGSGKTTTLATCLSEVPTNRKIYTIEDPVEKIVSNASQVPVNTDKDDRSFANMARQTLRMDPDTITIGEVRDQSTAVMMARAALTGHLVLSTVHTNSAVNITSRLSELGLSDSLLSDPNFLVLLAFQRLVTVLCEDCKMPISESAKHQEKLPIWRKVFNEGVDCMYVRGQNPQCKTCNGRGITGRIVVAEVVWVDKHSRQFINNRDILGWQDYLVAQGLLTCQAHASQRVLAGQVDVLDAEAVVGQFDPTLLVDNFDYHQLTEQLAGQNDVQ